MLSPKVSPGEFHKVPEALWNKGWTLGLTVSGQTECNTHSESVACGHSAHPEPRDLQEQLAVGQSQHWHRCCFQVQDLSFLGRCRVNWGSGQRPGGRGLRASFASKQVQRMLKLAGEDPDASQRGPCRPKPSTAQTQGAPVPAQECRGPVLGGFWERCPGSAVPQNVRVLLSLGCHNFREPLSLDLDVGGCGRESGLLWCSLLSSDLDKELGGRCRSPGFHLGTSYPRTMGHFLQPHWVCPKLPKSRVSSSKEDTCFACGPLGSFPAP